MPRWTRRRSPATRIIEGFTLIDLCRELRIEPTPAFTWPAGALLRDTYEREFGRLPPKDNRAKTNGPGAHCFAIYPDTWRARARQIVQAIKADRERQIDIDDWLGDWEGR